MSVRCLHIHLLENRSGEDGDIYPNRRKRGQTSETTLLRIPGLVKSNLNENQGKKPSRDWRHVEKLPGYEKERILVSIGPFTVFLIYLRYLLTWLQTYLRWPQLTCIALQSRDSSLMITIITDGMEDNQSKGLKTLAKAAKVVISCGI